ncbi:MAG: hypothetical protein WCL39_01310 [Armatimonadota bacterium]
MTLRLLLCAVAATACIGCGSKKQQVTFDLSPRGDVVAFSAKGAGGSDLYLLRLSDSRITRITNTSAFEEYPSFTPDGGRLVYVSGDGAGGPSHIETIGLDGKGRKAITNKAVQGDFTPSTAPDGQSILFVRGTRKSASYGWVDDDVYSVRSDSGQLRRHTRLSFPAASAPEMVRGTGNIIFTAEVRPSTTFGIYSVPASSSGTIPPKRLRSSGFQSSVSHDGKFVAFVDDLAKEFDFEVWIMNTDGTQSRQITRNGSYNHWPKVAPGSKRVFFLSEPDRNARYELWSIALDGTDITRIAGSELFDDPLAWSPAK